MAKLYKSKQNETELAQIWVIGHFYSGLAGSGPNLAVAMLLPACGSDLANSNGPPKCHHYTQYVGHMKVSGAGQTCARTILPSGLRIRFLLPR